MTGVSLVACETNDDSTSVPRQTELPDQYRDYLVGSLEDLLRPDGGGRSEPSRERCPCADGRRDHEYEESFEHHEFPLGGT